MNEPLIQVTAENTATVIRLNRPERHNALVPELLQALTEALKGPAVTEANCLVIAAGGRSFSTGGDLRGFWNNRDRIADYAMRLVGQLNEVILALYSAPVPVACAVQGQVTGGSLGLLLACDRIFMHQSVTIRPWYTTVGFSPDGGWTALLPDAIGERPTLAWLTDDGTQDAEACLAMGLAQEVTERDPLGAALDWSRQIRLRSAGSLSNARRLARRPVAEVAKRLEAERQAFVTQVQTDEAITGLAHFLGEPLPGSSPD